MHNFHSFSRLTNPVIPFPLTDRWRKISKRILRPEILWTKKKKDRKLKKKTDIKKYYASFRERYPRMPKDTIRHDTTRRDKDLPRGKQKGERSDMYDGSWMLHDCLDHYSTYPDTPSRLLAYRKYCSLHCSTWSSRPIVGITRSFQRNFFNCLNG